MRIFRTAIESGMPDGDTCTLYYIIIIVGTSGRRPTTPATAKRSTYKHNLIMCAERAFVVDVIQYRVVSPSCLVVRFANFEQLGLCLKKKKKLQTLFDHWSCKVYSGGYAARRIMTLTNRQTPDHSIMLIAYLLLVLCTGRLIDAEKGKLVSLV